MKLNLGQDSEARFGQNFKLILKLVLGRDSEDVCSIFVQELVIWPTEVTLVSRTQPSGPLCLWQYLKDNLPIRRAVSESLTSP